LRVGLILKATRRCNLRCHYCHDWRSGREHDMSFETVARTTAAVLHHPLVDRALFTWHGGEPTLMPLDFYRRALLAQSRLKRDGQKVGNAIQTNATRLDHPWCQFLADNRFYVGVSIDGPSALQDVQRPFISGRGSSREVERGIRLLKEWGIDHGVLMVIDRAWIDLGPRVFFDFIVTLGVKRIGLNAARPTNDPTFFERPKSLLPFPPEHYTTPGEMNAFLLGLYDECERNADAGIEIRELEALRRRINDKEGRTCTLAGACIGKHFLVEPNGDFAHCDLFVGDPAYTVGNVYDSDFRAIHESEAMVQLRRGEDDKHRSMSSCPSYRVCNGGCPHDRYLAMRHDPRHRESCCGQRDLIVALTERMRGQKPTAAAGATHDR